MSVTYHQTDPRWANLRYAGGTMRTSGCGAAAVAMIAVNNPKYAKVTPKDVRKFLEPKFTVKGKGTLWRGIAAAGKHYGLNVTQFSAIMRMFDDFDRKGDTWGVILMNNKTHNGIKWTSSGHYLAFSAYKKDSKGRHWLYLRDPNPARNHTGWYCYEKHFKGNIKAVWAYRLPKSEAKPRPEKPKPPKPTQNKYTGKLPTLPSTLEKRAVECAYAYGTSKSVYKYIGGKAKAAYKAALDKAYPNRKWGKQTTAGASCDVFVGTCVRVAGVNSKFPRGLAEQKPYLKKYFNKVKTAKSGDIVHRRNHIGIYVALKGVMYVANAHYAQDGGTYGIIEKSKNFDTYYRPKYIASYFSKGDTFTEVKYLQEFLAWFGAYKGAIDYSFGAKTDDAVRLYQLKKGLKVDGIVGIITLAAMREDSV